VSSGIRASSLKVGIGLKISIIGSRVALVVQLPPLSVVL